MPRQVVKLVAKLLWLILPVYLLIFTYIESMPVYYNSQNNNRWYYMKQRLNEPLQAGKINVLFLGESRVNAGIDINQIPESWSFAAGGATAIEMYYSLIKYLKNNEKPTIIYFSLSPRSMTSIYSFWEFAVRNNFFSFSEIHRILELSNQLENHNTLGYTVFTEADIAAGRNTEENRHYTPPFLKYTGYKINFLPYYQLDIRNNFLFAAKNDNLQMIAQMDSMRGRRFHPVVEKKGSSGLNYETGMSHFTVPPLLDFYLKKLLNTCVEENIYVIFEPSPMNVSSVEVLKNQFIKEYKNYIHNLENQFPTFYFTDTFYTYPDSLFGDPSHLNPTGRDKFTRFLIEKHFNRPN